MWMEDSKSESGTWRALQQKVEAVIYMLPETYMRRIKESLRAAGCSDLGSRSRVIEIVRGPSLRPWDRLRLVAISALAT